MSPPLWEGGNPLTAAFSLLGVLDPKACTKGGGAQEREGGGNAAYQRRRYPGRA